MILVIAMLVVIAALFAVAFFSKRRFGILGLGLSAGAIISPIWGENAGYIISATGLVPEGPLVNVIAYSVLILVPALLFMFHGYVYKGIIGRIVGALLFTILAAAFLAGPVGDALTLTGPIASSYAWLVSNHEIIISVGVVLAIVDLLLSKSAHKSEKRHR
jgi:hypothetical protein